MASGEGLGSCVFLCVVGDADGWAVGEGLRALCAVGSAFVGCAGVCGEQPERNWIEISRMRRCKGNAVDFKEI